MRLFVDCITATEQARLNEAYQGYKSDPQLFNGIKEYLASLMAQDLIPSPALPGDFSRCKQIQNKVYKIFLRSKFDEHLSETVNTRINKMVSPLVPEIQDSDMQNAFQIMRGFHGHDSIRIMKTWSHAWCTSDRYSETVILPCLFGCVGAIDKQAHYIMCPYMYTLQSFMWTDEVSADPLARLALKDTSCSNLKLVACTFSGYHNLKFNHAARFHPGGDLDPTVELPGHALKLFRGSFANVFRAEAMELGLNTRRFDPDAFNSFVSGQSAINDVATPLALPSPEV